MEKQSKTFIEKMIDKQKELIKLYTPIENLPTYPVDITKRPGQKLIKDFVRRVVEELAEAHETMSVIYTAMDSNDTTAASNLLDDHNMEIADTLHFLLETLIFMGYEDNLRRVFQTLPDMLQGLCRNDNPLQSIFSLGGYCNFQQNLHTNRPGYFEIPMKPKDPNEYPYMGNRKISLSILEDQSVMLWNITWKLKMMCNEMRNREWSQEHKALNITMVETRLAEALVYFGQYLDYGKFTQIGIYHYYNKKNAINIERIKKGY